MFSPLPLTPLSADCRNDYESDLGRFKNAIALNTSKFSESWDRLDAILETVPKDAKIMTYCTGTCALRISYYGSTRSTVSHYSLSYVQEGYDALKSTHI